MLQFLRKSWSYDASHGQTGLDPSVLNFSAPMLDIICSHIPAKPYWPYKLWKNNENIIDIQTIAVQVSMMFFYAGSCASPAFKHCISYQWAKGAANHFRNAFRYAALSMKLLWGMAKRGMILKAVYITSGNQAGSWNSARKVENLLAHSAIIACTGG